MRLAPGSSLGPYAIESTLGAGGMGEVYRARDTRLDRSVAVKVLGDAVAHDPQFRERFEREARAISALSHPHICTLFDVGHAGDVPYLVMELLEGETLAARLTRGALPPAQAFPIAIQIGSALIAAHRAGIIHRDLKPGNIMLTRMRADPAGSPHAKLLDFGLARSSSRDSGSATTQVALTTSGETVGTIPYMSPEQLEGRPLDARSDIWSFGCVLYEMFAGHRAFAGDSDARVISEILTTEPAPVASASLDRVIRKCLAKDPERRWQTSADLTDELQWISSQETTGDRAPATSIAATKRPRRWRDVILAAVGLILAALAFGAGYLLRPPPQVPVWTFDVPPPPGASWGDSLALSPDGRRLVFVAFTAGKAHLWLRDLGSLDARQLPGTDGADFGLFWSPDGVSIGFFASGKLKTIRADGGPVSELAAAPTPGGGTWNRDGVIVYSPDLSTTSKTKGLWRVPAIGGKAVSLTTPEDETHRAPVFLPNGRHLLYIRPTGVFATSLDNPSQLTQVLPKATSVAFVAPGYLLFVRENTIWAQRFDPEKLTLLGEEVMTTGAVDPASDRQWLRAFSATDSGVLAYRSAAAVQAVRQFVWLDRKGRELGRLDFTGALQNPVLSPDEKRVAFAMEQSGNSDIYVMEVASGVTSRRTFSKESDDYPVWSRDSLRIAFRRSSGGAPNAVRGIFEVSADGKGSETLLRALNTNESTLYPRGYAPDSRALIYLAFARGTSSPNGGIYALPLAGGGSATKWLDTPENELVPRLSPDGKWMAYGSQEGNRQELYVQRYPETGAKAQISEDGLRGLVEWHPNGQELFYLGPGSGLWAVPMKDGARAGPKKFLFNLGTFSFREFSISKDGQRFLVNRPASGSDEKTIAVVTNWLTLMKK